MKRMDKRFGLLVSAHPQLAALERKIRNNLRRALLQHKAMKGAPPQRILRINLNKQQAATVQRKMTTMDSEMDDTVGSVVVVPHTPRALGSSVERIINDGVTVVSVDTRGSVMSALFSDGSDGLLWYRSPREGSDFSLSRSALNNANT
jgi:hypothetical protein